MLNHKNAFYTYLFTVVNIMAKHDQQFDQDEFYYVSNIMKKYKHKYDDEKEFSAVLNYIRDEGLSPIELLKRSSSLLDLQEKLEVFQFAFKIAILDGELDTREEKIISEIQKYSNIPKEHFNLLLENARLELLDLQFELTKIQSENEKIKLIRQYFTRDDILKCPDCPQTYMSTVQFKYIKFDYCHKGCGGLWTDKDEIFHLIENAKDKISTDVTNLKRSQKVCPRCDHKFLETIPLLKSSNTTVDKCPKCSGIWLGKKQLHLLKNALQESGIIEHLTETFNDLSKHGYKID